MNGLLVVNRFLHNGKFDELTELFQLAASEQSITLDTIGNDCWGISLDSYDFILFWDKDILLADWMAGQRILVFNSGRAIELCDDKRKTWMSLEQAKIPTPRTIPAPMTYSNIGYTDTSFIQEIEKTLHFPMIVKEAFGSFGQQVYLIHNHHQLEQKVKELQGIPFLFQEYIEESKGRDIRLQVVGDEVIASMYRYSDSDFRANISAGGHMKSYEPSQEEKELAIRACHAVGADFAGVDLLFAGEKRVVCEVNSNAHFKNIMDCTGVNTAQAIMEYIKKRIQNES